MGLTSDTIKYLEATLEWYKCSVTIFVKELIEFKLNHVKSLIEKERGLNIVD